jgi:hypothetical protein
MNADLSGHWQGVYNYPGEVEAVHFDAWLTESNGSLSGETAEPGLASESAAIAYALISGSRSGARVTFTKVYDALGYEPIAYEGDLDGSGNEIHGRWTISGHRSGNFLMKRVSESAADEEVEAEETV